MTKDDDSGIVDGQWIRREEPVSPDATDKGADWIKGTWDLPEPGTPEYEALSEANGGLPLRPSWRELADGEDYRPSTAKRRRRKAE